MRCVVPVLILLTAAAACGGRGEDFNTPVIWAARNGDVQAIQALAAAGANLNAFGGNDWTPLLHAIHKGRSESVKALITAGANVNRTSSGGLSPLEMAAGNGQLTIVRQLLEAGADPREPGVFPAAVSGGALMDIEQPLLGQCHTEVVRALLQRTPDLSLPDNARGHLSMMFARWNSCGEVIQLVRFNRG